MSADPAHAKAASGLTIPPRAGAALLALVLVAGSLLRAARVELRSGREHDDVLVFTASAGKDVRMWEALLQRWTPAGEWADFLVPSPDATPSGIAKAVTDFGHIHPPLWYWAVHSWTRVFGVGLRSVPALNLLASIGTGLLLFALARRLLPAAGFAVLAVALWAFSPGTVGLTALERPYELLTFVTLALGALLVPLPAPGERVPPVRLAGVGLAAAAGLLLHYQFLIVLASAAVVLAVASRADVRGRISLGLALAAGAAAHLAVAPGLLAVFRRAVPSGGAEASPGLLARLASPVQPGVTLLDHSFFTAPWTEPASLVFAAAWALALVALLSCALPALRRSAPTGLSSTALAGLFGLAILGGAQATWVLGLLPSHAVTTRYVSNAYPFLAIGLAGAVALLPRPAVWAGVLASLQLASGLFYLETARAEARHGLEGLALLARAEAVVLDNPQSGIAPRLVDLLPRGTPVYGATRERLLADPGAWSRGPRQGCRSVAWVSALYPWDRPSPAAERAIADALGEAFREEGAAAPLLRIGTVRLFVARPAP